MLVTEAEPDGLAPLAPPAPFGLRGVWVVRRAVAPRPWRGVLTCPRASMRARLGRAPPPTSDPRLPVAGALLLITGRERILSRRGCWGCYAGRTGPRSPPSWNPPAGSRTRCGGSLPAWCARSSGSSLPRRRPTAGGGIVRALLAHALGSCRARAGGRTEESSKNVVITKCPVGVPDLPSPRLRAAAAGRHSPLRLQDRL